MTLRFSFDENEFDPILVTVDGIDNEIKLVL